MSIYTAPATSATIVDGAIIDADVNASAAIAGTKISPNFGGQAVVTTGTITGASLIPSSATAPANGLYLPAANSVALSTGSTGRLFIDSSGRVGVGTSSPQTTLNIVHGVQFDPASSVVSSAALFQNTGGIAGLNAYGAAITLSKINSARPGAAIASVQTSADEDQLGMSFLVHSSSAASDILYEAARISHAGTWAVNAAAGIAPAIFNIGASEVARLDSSGRLLVGTSSAVAGSTAKIQSSTTINLASCPTYADDAAAGTGGLVAGDIYKTATGELRIKL